jgi:hypothetical protein
MTVVVGYLPNPEGEAAFGAALDEAARRREDLVVLNSPRSGALVSADVAAPDVVVDLTTRAAAAGVAVDVRQAPHTGEFSDLLLGVADQVERGSRSRQAGFCPIMSCRRASARALRRTARIRCTVPGESSRPWRVCWWQMASMARCTVFVRSLDSRCPPRWGIR